MGVIFDLEEEQEEIPVGTRLIDLFPRGILIDGQGEIHGLSS